MPLIIAGAVVMAILIVTSIMMLREFSFAARAPFIIGTAGSAAIFNAVDKGNSGLVWWLIPIIVVLIPLTPSALRKSAHDSYDEQPPP